MNSKLNIVFTIDERFIQHFTVTLVSVLENNKHISLNIYVVHDIENMKLLNEVADFIKKKYKVTLNLIYVDNSVFANYRVSLHYSKAVYFRLLITEILPEKVEQALFLDADVVVTGSLSELAEYKFKNDDSLLAVNDVEVNAHISRLNKMGFPLKRYFNAGVLLINVKAWREKKLSGKFIAMADQYMAQLEWWDQDILNMFFYNEWVEMDKKFNALHLRKKLETTPTIIHYAGAAKPWLYVHTHPYKSLYWNYLKLTPFKDFKYPDYNLKEFLRRHYIALLDFLKLREPAISNH